MKLANRGTARLDKILVLGALLVGAAALAGLRPAAEPATAQESPKPDPTGAGAPPAAQADEVEEHGGDLIFHVISRTQKYSVLYSHELHVNAGIQCDECHETVFKKKINGQKFKMADINRGQYCGVCHTETPAPEVKHPAFAPKKNCAKCHTMRVREPDSK